MKIRVCYYYNFIVLIFLLISFGCSVNQEEKLWKETSDQNTIVAYQGYLQKFPEGPNVNNAHDGIQRLHFTQAEENPDQVWSIYDQYISEYPEGSFIPLFETLIYNQAAKENTLLAFEGYLKRYPNGMYVKEFETAIFTNIKEGKSDLTYEDFVVSFPQSSYNSEIDNFYFNLAEQTPDEINLEKYMQLFPQGKYISKVKTTLEDLKYNNILETATAELMAVFIENFADSKRIKRMMVMTSPDSVNVVITDLNGSEILTSKSPLSLAVIEGTTLKLKFDSPDYKPSSKEYFVTPEKNQFYKAQLDPTIKNIHTDQFDKKSIWEYKSQNNNLVVNETGMLACEVRDYQFQRTNAFEVDFNEDFTIEMSFKFKNQPDDTKSYTGFIWGKSLNFNYFFVADNGKYGYGRTESRYIAVENINGYSNWYYKSDNSDKWFTSNNFSKSDFNSLVVEKKGKKYFYKLNGQTLFMDEIAGVSSGNNIGIGMGDARVEIDFIKILQ